MTPSPFSRLATALVSGLVSTAAQTFAGAKTFTAAIIASAGVQLSALWNTNGSGASDVGVKVGFSTADASVNSTAKPWAVYTGIGGTEVLKASVNKAGDLTTLGGVSCGGAISTSSPSGAAGFQFSGTAVLWESGSTLVLRARGAAVNYSPTVPAIWLIPFGAVDATDLIVSVADASGVPKMTVNGRGDVVAYGASQLNADGVARPTASAAVRGTLWYSKSANGAADTVEICLKSAADTYSWVVIATG